MSAWAVGRLTDVGSSNADPEEGFVRQAVRKMNLVEKRI